MSFNDGFFMSQISYRPRTSFPIKLVILVLKKSKVIVKWRETVSKEHKISQIF